ncbi:hypothetical protein DFH07DRAFT_988045 [Mycena maculata]|uniref:RPN1 N-terminal domain-containing protein n=1 Tax=Mycena maculata TaxID=230809 RepID=A0AAD7MVQ7_9AGAR|nr:hypothetical protein DFH07DRAFT_988045 [Mycena maculata]
MTYSDAQPQGTLRYRLLSASLRPACSPLADPGTWRHEYVCYLAAELGDEYTFREQESDEPTPPQRRARLKSLLNCLILLPPPDDVSFLKTACTIYMQHRKFPKALALAIRLGDPRLFEKISMLLETQIDIEDEFPEDLRECLSNTRLSRHFRDFGKELDRGNLAGTFVNVFVNAGVGNDKLMVEAEEGNSWVYKNKYHGMMSATASLGLSLLWDTDLDRSHIDKYTYSEEYMKAGALLATGILSSGVRTEADVAKGLIGEYVDNKSVPLKTSAIMRLGMAYAGSHREDLLQLFIPHVLYNVSMEVASLATLALGFIFVGSENGEITGTILQTLMENAERSDAGLDEKWARFMALGVGLLYLVTPTTQRDVWCGSPDVRMDLIPKLAGNIVLIISDSQDIKP